MSQVFRLVFLITAITGVTAAANVPAAPTQTGKPKAPAAQQSDTSRATLVKNLDANFKSMDANGDGTLSQSEIAAAEAKAQQQRLAQIRERMDAEFAKLDANRDGNLSKAEFMAASPSAGAAAPTGAALLSQLDKNKDGKVTADEYRAPVIARFDAADSNHDGVLNSAERQALKSARRP